MAMGYYFCGQPPHNLRRQIPAVPPRRGAAACRRIWTICWANWQGEERTALTMAISADRPAIPDNRAPIAPGNPKIGRSTAATRNRPKI